MSVQRSTCLRCCMEVADRQSVDPYRQLCGRCQQPMAIRLVVVDSAGLTALRLAIFNRLKSPRPVHGVKNSTGNICLEQLATCITHSWRHLGSHETSRMRVESWCLVEWSDIAQFCKFQQVASRTRNPSHGRGNVRLAGSTMGIICPPVIITHR